MFTVLLLTFAFAYGWHCKEPATKCGAYCCQWASANGCQNVCCSNGDCGCTENNCQYGEDAVFLSIVEKIKKTKCKAGQLGDCGCKGLSAQVKFLKNLDKVKLFF